MIESLRDDVETLPAPSKGAGGNAPHRAHWFPVAFEVDLDPAAPTRVTVFGTGYVLFRDAKGALNCLPDRCPHRCARLSDGRVEGGRIECMYHGWTFDGEGTCARIPQLAPDQSIPRRANLDAIPLEIVQGIVWIWGGPIADADPERIVRNPELDRPGVKTIDYATDLPYGQEAFVENVLDFAHIHIAHDGARGGGHRAHAGPLSFDVEDLGPRGFRARFLSQTVDEGASGATTAGATVTFDAPNLVHYVSTFDDEDRVGGLALFSIPLEHDRCRMIYRAYGNAWPQRDLKRPRWREHIYQMELLEQDMAVVLGQTQELRDESRSLRDVWLPIKSSDQLVLQYRRWIDEHAADTPGALGWRTRNDVEPTREPIRIDRFALHTSQCRDCRAALALMKRVRSGAHAGAFGGLLAAALLTGPLRIVAALVAVGALGAAARARRWIDALTRGPRTAGTWR
ncbi:MAG: Rieske 2Fe-2S domain-containing protein [Planctomycetota bacterium]